MLKLNELSLNLRNYTKNRVETTFANSVINILVTDQIDIGVFLFVGSMQVLYRWSSVAQGTRKRTFRRTEAARRYGIAGS